MSDNVRLVDLEMIKRYSLAVRQEWASADEVLAVLATTRRQVLAAQRAATRERPERGARRPRPESAGG